MDELKRIRRSNIRVIIAIILVIIYFIITVNWYDNALEEIRKSEREWNIRKIVEPFNTKMSWYIGNNKIGSSVKALCGVVITINSVNEDKRVFVKEGDISQLKTKEDWENSNAVYKIEEIEKLRNSIYNSLRYDVSASYDEQGFIIGIGITQKSMVQNLENEV